MDNYYFIPEPKERPSTVEAYVGRHNAIAFEASHCFNNTPLIAPLVAYTPISNDEAIYQIRPNLVPFVGDNKDVLYALQTLEQSGIIYGNGAIMWDTVRRLPVLADWQYATLKFSTHNTQNGISMERVS